MNLLGLLRHLHIFNYKIRSIYGRKQLGSVLYMRNELKIFSLFANLSTLRVSIILNLILMMYLSLLIILLKIKSEG